MGSKSQEPRNREPPIALGSFDTTLDFVDDKDRNAHLEWFGICGEQPRAMCCHCHYWSGKVDNNPADLICAVNIPRPTKEALDAANCIPAFAVHDCQDFEKESEPVNLA